MPFERFERFEWFEEEVEERNFAIHERPTKTAEEMQRLCLGEVRRGQTVLLSTALYKRGKTFLNAEI